MTNKKEIIRSVFKNLIGNYVLKNNNKKYEIHLFWCEALTKYKGALLDMFQRAKGKYNSTLTACDRETFEEIWRVVD